MDDTFILSAGISGAIGSLAPFLLPSFFNLLVKIFKRELAKEEKRLVITALSITIAFVVIIVNFEWTREFKTDIVEFAQFFFINFVTIKGMIQTIYELVIKSIPALEEKFS